jgi:hypothetical protein
MLTNILPSIWLQFVLLTLTISDGALLFNVLVIKFMLRPDLYASARGLQRNVVYLG